MWSERKKKNTGRLLWGGTKVVSAILQVVLLLAVVLLAVFRPTGAVPITADESDYRTTTVTRGTMAVEARMPATYEYTETVPVVFNPGCGDAIFMGYVVEKDQYVQEGEPIANIIIGVDEISLKEVQLRLERAELERDKAYAAMEEAHAAAERAVAESTGTQNQIARLRLEQLEMEQERSRRSADESVAAVKEQLSVYENAIGMTQILAPVSGQVSRLNYYGVGSVLPDGAQIGILRSTEETIFSTTDTNNILRYGMSVTLIDGQGNRSQCQVVSSAEKYLSGSFTGGKSYFKPESQWGWGYDVIYENVHIENVLLVDSEAVNTDKNGTYVLELKDGKLSKCYFTVGKTVKNLCYAIDGLSEGMTVIIQ